MSAVSLPNFNAPDAALFSKQLDELLSNNRQEIAVLLTNQDAYTWENLMQPLEEMENSLEHFWSPLAHLNAVVNSPELRRLYKSCLPKLSAYEAAIGHNHALFKAIESIDKETLNRTQIKIIEDNLRNFKLAGVALTDEDKKQFEGIQTRLSELSNSFENNVLDASQAYELHISDESRMAGLPDHAVHLARTLAAEKGLDGWLLNLEIPCFLAVASYADDRALREEMHHAYVTRASDQGPNAGEFDNSTIMNEILLLRSKKATLLGFDNYAALSLATKMAESPNHVYEFLNDLCFKARPQALNEFKQLKEFGQKAYQIAKIEPWDVSYLSEKKQQLMHSITQEELRPFFPLDKVAEGMFAIIKKLYGISFERLKADSIWHPDVQTYQLSDDNQKPRGFLYMDLFARPKKRGGAWMDSCQNRYQFANGDVQLPIAMLTCNFAKPPANKPPTLSHDEVLTFFHEMGHCLQHLLTQVDYLDAAGINGVEWDAVELPSQFFENWCWEEEALRLLTAHVDTGEALSPAYINKLMNAKNFQSAMVMMRQLEFSLFDFRIHQQYDPEKPTFIADTLNDIRQNTSVTPTTAYNRFQHSFTHIFSGGYAAGYYSYKWAEVLSSDAYSRFEEEGLFNAATGNDFLKNILEVGGSQKAKDAFEAFRGRPATVDALLRHNGII